MALFEYRVYEAVPGKLPALHSRFQTMTLGHFKKHGIGVVGFWEAVAGTTQRAALHPALRRPGASRKSLGRLPGRRRRGFATAPKPSATARSSPACATSSGAPPTTRPSSKFSAGVSKRLTLRIARP